MDEEFEKQGYERQRARWEEDSDDLNREAAGVQGNRIARFKSDDADSRLGTTNKKDEDAGEFAEFVMWALASSQDIARLRTKIGLLDSASLEALRETEGTLEGAREDLKHIRDNAYQLPDGRKVYRTEDGNAVYDDDGNQVSPSVIDPKNIPPEKSSWEKRQQAGERVEDLETQQQDIQGYRTRLDRTRKRLDDDNITQDELDELDKELENDMPDAVRQHRDRLAANDPDSKAEPTRTTSAAARHDAGPGFETAPEVGESFAVAVAGLPESPRPATAPSAQPRDDFTV